MARRVFFSFQYDNDVWKANQVRDSNVVAGMDVAGFFGQSEYKEAKNKRKEAIKQMILRHLDGTSVTVVLIGTQTANRPWVKYEIEQSIAQKNGLLGIQIHHLKNEHRLSWGAQNRPLIGAFDLLILTQCRRILFATSTVSVRTNGTCGKKNAWLSDARRTRPLLAGFNAPRHTDQAAIRPRRPEIIAQVCHGPRCGARWTL